MTIWTVWRAKLLPRVAMSLFHRKKNANRMKILFMDYTFASSTDTDQSYIVWKRSSWAATDHLTSSLLSNQPLPPAVARSFWGHTVSISQSASCQKVVSHLLDIFLPVPKLQVCFWYQCYWQFLAIWRLLVLTEAPFWPAVKAFTRAHTQHMVSTLNQCRKGIPSWCKLP